MTFAYKVTPEVHTLRGAIAGFRYLSTYGPFRSLLDVGAGPGTWMSAARLAGVSDVCGIDISNSASNDNILKECRYEVLDASGPFDLHRKFDCLICLEVAEHLEEQSAKVLVSSLCRHGDMIFFSAAQPGQFGQNHLNCQWPSYWQELYNAEGFRCVDDVRWRMWCDPDIEPWYRQNMFRVVRDSMAAGSEPRIPAVIHPEMLNLNIGSSDSQDTKLSYRSRVFKSVKAMVSKVANLE